MVSNGTGNILNLNRTSSFHLGVLNVNKTNILTFRNGNSSTLNGTENVTRIFPMEILDNIEYSIRNFIISMYWGIAPILILVGIVGNILTLLVINKIIKGENKPAGKHFVAAHIYIRWMAVSDIVDCLSFIPYPIMYYLGKFLQLRYVYTYGFAFYIASIQFVLLNSFYKVSVFIILLIAIDRFIAICYAFKYKTLVTPNFVNVTTAVAYILGVCMAINETFKYSPALRFDHRIKRWIWFANINSTVSNPLILYVYSWMKEGVSSLIPMILLCLFNWKIARSFKEMMKKKKGIAIEKSIASMAATSAAGGAGTLQIGSAVQPAKKAQTLSNEDRELTSLMMGIVIVYFIANIPLSLHFILGILKPQYYMTVPFVTYLHVTNMFAMAHTSANFFIYLFFNKNFKKTLFNMFGIEQAPEKGKLK